MFLFNICHIVTFAEILLIFQTAGLILAGLGMAAVGFAGRYALKYSKPLAQTLKKSIDQLPQGAVSLKYVKFLNL